MGKKSGRPGPDPIQIDWIEFDKLVSYQCTQEELADFFLCDVDTLNNACLRERGLSLSDIWNKRKAAGKVRLRRLQFEIVERGGPGAATMAIYLDKKMFPNERVDVPPPPAGAPSPPTSESAPAPRKKTFSEFCAAALYPPPYARQEEMKDFVVTAGPPRVLLGSRGYGKTDYSTILGDAYSIYENWFDGLHRDKETAETVLIVSKSKTRNAAMIEEIAGALEANGVPLEKQNASCIRVEGLAGKDHSCEAVPLKASFRGRHPKRIVMDDPVTEDDVSEAQRALVKRKYSEAYKLCKNLVVIGQPAHAFDLYSELRPRLKKMEVPHGSIPELDEDLEAMIAAGVDKDSIEMSYHLRIPVSGTTPFALIKFCDDLPDGDSVAFLDPSDGGDFTALSIGRMIGNGLFVQGHAWQKAWYLCDDLVQILVARKVRRLCFETNATGTQPIVQLRALLAPHGIGVVGVHSDTNKHAAIMSAGSMAPLIHLSKKSDHAYTEQVTKYEHRAKFDDAPDSLARLLIWLGLIKGKK